MKTGSSSKLMAAAIFLAASMVYQSTAAQEKPAMPTPAPTKSEAPVAESGGMGVIKTRPTTPASVQRPASKGNMDELTPEILEAMIAATGSTLPMPPELIRRFKSRAEQSQRAAAVPTVGVPSRRGRTITISTSNSAEDATIYVSPYTSPNFTTSVSLIDSTGQPWKITSVQSSNSDEIDAVLPEKGGNKLNITPLANYVYGNLTLTLEDLPYSISLSVEHNLDQIDGRVTARIAARGPRAKAPIMDTPVPDAGSEIIMTFLDGVPASGARPLNIDGASRDDASAWMFNGQVYLRTTGTVLSPAWVNTASSADGTTVFVLPETPIVITSFQGKMINLKISERSAL